MFTATILSGADRYWEQYHDFAATSQEIAETLARVGIRARIRSHLRKTLEDLGDIDLLVVNCSGNPREPEPGETTEWADAHAGLLNYLRAGRPVLGIHTASITFADVPDWDRWLGARWRRGRSMHPPIGTCRVDVRTDQHPIVEGLPDFDLYDERYSYLDVDPAVDPLITHEHDGIVHPLVWAREVGDARVVYDALGHGVESYASPHRRQLLQREALWALDSPIPAASA